MDTQTYIPKANKDKAPEMVFESYVLREARTEQLNKTVFISEFFRQTKELATKCRIFIKIGGSELPSVNLRPDKYMTFSTDYAIAINTGRS